MKWRMQKMEELIERLRSYGADPDAALHRFLGDEELYRTLLGEFLRDPDVELLDSALAGRDFPKAFRAAHNLKGAAATLSLTPLYHPLEILVEDLRPVHPLPWKNDYDLFRKEMEEYGELLEGVV